MNRGTDAYAIAELADRLIPAGVIWEWAGTTLPDPTIYGAWAWADGAAVSRAQYPRLFKNIGVFHGAGDGSTTFNLPNRQGRVGVGRDGTTEFLTVGQIGGSKTSTALHTHNLQSHTHAGTSGVPSNNGSDWPNNNTSGGRSAQHNHGYTTGNNYAFSYTNDASGNHAHGSAINTTSTAHDHHYTGDGQYASCPGGANSFAGYNIGGFTATHAHFREHAHGGTVDGENQEHTHSLSNHTHNLSNHTHTTTTGGPSNNTSEGSNVGATSGNLPPYITVNYIIKV